MRHLIVIPAYNEEAALPATLDTLQNLPDDFEILVVNDGSRDGTRAAVQAAARTSKLPLHIVHLALNSGIGVAVQTGYVFAARQGTYRYVIQFDADGQHDPAALPELIRGCEAKDLDLCIGSRFLAAEPDAFRSTWPRRLGIRFLAGVIWVLTGVAVTDPTSGLRCAGPRAWQHFARHYPDDYPEPEALFWCARHKLRIGEIPVRMYARQRGESSIQGWQPLYYMLKVTLAILFDRIRRKEHA